MHSDNKNNKNKIAVLDTSALQALFLDDQYADRASQILEESCLSVLTLCDVLNQFHKEGGAVTQIQAQINKLKLDLHAFDITQAAITSQLLDQPLGIALSFYDRAAIALAKSLHLPLYTTQKQWKNLALPVTIKLL